MRRSLVWLVALPLMLAGSQAAHLLAYRWAYPQAAIRLDALVRTGHGYLSLLPSALAVAGGVVLLALLAAGVAAARGRRSGPLPAWAFALLPLVGFAVQEHVERWLYSGVVPWHEAFAPTFGRGLVLQLPFAALAYVSARLLLRAAERVGVALAPAGPPRPRLLPVSPPLPAAAALPPRPPVLSRGLAKRGPPLLLGA